MTSVVLAEGGTQHKLAQRGKIHFQAARERGLVIVEGQNTQAPAGLDLLPKFKKQLNLDPTPNKLRP